MKTRVRVDDAVDAVERVCAGSTSADELLESLSAELHRTVPHDGSTWFGMDPVTMIAVEPSRVENLDGSLCDTYWHLEFHEQDTALFTDLATGGGAAALGQELDGKPARSIRYRDFMRPQGFGDELRGVFQRGESTWGVVGLYREEGRDPFDETDVAIVKGIGGIVADALRTHVRDRTPWLCQPTAPGLLVLDRGGRVRSANQEAQKWVDCIWPGASFEQATIPTPLVALVARARAVADGRDDIPARMRVRDERGRWVVLHASSLASPGDAADGTVAVVIEAAKSAEIAPIIIESYSLTARERDVLGAISRGASTNEIAAELYLSPHTVRDYVKTVFEKVGVKSRGELVARLFGEHYADRLHETMVDVH